MVAPQSKEGRYHEDQEESDEGKGGQATENRSQGRERSSLSGKSPDSRRQVHQGHLQPDWREGMPPIRSDDVEGARCAHGEARKRGCAGTLRKAFGVRQDDGVKPLFTLGQVVATPGALAALEKAGQQPGDFLARCTGYGL